jgi:glycosyltransferase involved in cell wall biosynthesis
MAQICIVTPGHLSTNPRVVKEAQALSAAGHQVSVIAGRYSPWAIEADRAFDAQPWAGGPRASFGPLAPLPARLRQKTQRVVGAALSRWSKTAGPKAAAMALHDVSLDLARQAVAVKADLYIAHYDAALWAAAAAARRHGALYAFDAEDFHPGDLPDTAANAAVNALLRRLEAALLPGCAFVTAASPGIADAYAAAYGLPGPAVILNVFPLAEAPPAPPARGAMQPAPSMYWFSQTIGPDRGLEWAVEAIGLARSQPHLYVRGQPAAGYQQKLQSRAAELGLADRVHILPPLPPQVLIAQMQAFDLGYIGETGETHNRRIAITNKLFSYLLAGLPVIASDIAAHKALSATCGEALSLFGIGDPAGLAQVIDALLLSPERLAQARASAWRLGQQRFNWELEGPKLAEIVDRALAARRAP